MTHRASSRRHRRLARVSYAAAAASNASPTSLAPLVAYPDARAAPVDETPFSPRALSRANSRAPRPRASRASTPRAPRPTTAAPSSFAPHASLAPFPPRTRERGRDSRYPPSRTRARARARARARRDAARVVLASFHGAIIHDESMRALAPLCASSRASSRDARVVDRVFRSRRNARANALGEHNSALDRYAPPHRQNSMTTTGPTTTTGSGTTTNGSVNATDPLVAQARETLAMSEVGDLLMVTAGSAQMGTGDGDGAGTARGTRATTVRTPRSCDGSSSDESA